jgi:hypothetical protein
MNANFASGSVFVLFGSEMGLAFMYDPPARPPLTLPLLAALMSILSTFSKPKGCGETMKPDAAHALTAQSLVSLSFPLPYFCDRASLLNMHEAESPRFDSRQ